MVYDCFNFDDELDMLEIRLATLHRVVDKFILVECEHTYMGDPKPLYFSQHANDPRFAPFIKQIVHIVYKGEPTGDPWADERSQRKAMYLGLDRVKITDTDIIFLCDVDEIWRPDVLHVFQDNVDHAAVLEMNMYRYAFDCKHSEKWHGPIVLRGKDLEGIVDIFRVGGPLPVPDVTQPSGLMFGRVVKIARVSRVIPACLHIEFNVPCGMLLLFRGTITTLVLPLYHPSKTSSFPCLLKVMPSWFSTHATSRLDRFLSILEAQRNRFKTFLLQLIFGKKECFQLIHRNRSIDVFLTAFGNHVFYICFNSALKTIKGICLGSPAGGHIQFYAQRGVLITFFFYKASYFHSFLLSYEVMGVVVAF